MRTIMRGPGGQPKAAACTSNHPDTKKSQMTILGIKKSNKSKTINNNKSCILKYPKVKRKLLISLRIRGYTKGDGRSVIKVVTVV